MITQAAQILDVPETELQEFSVQDPYNDNKLEGYLCRRGDHRYGAVVITKVNEKEVIQRIFATPKLHYPFTTNPHGERIFHWCNKKVKQARVYEKLDGTNICVYSYTDADGNRYVTAKTRLTPVLRQGSFGDFKSMWDTMQQMYPEVINPQMVLEGTVSLSFEMFGYRNPILIGYKVPLEARLLFAISQDTASIVPGDVLFPTMASKLEPQHKITNMGQMQQVYDQLRADAEKANKHTEDGLVEGSEGFVFYLLDENDTWAMVKCKPADIESIHWANESIHKNSIFTTCWNALENVDISGLTIDFVKELLKEEFSDVQIGKAEQRIDRCVKEVTGIVKFRQTIREEMDKVPKELNFKDHKRDIMRILSQSFKREDMKKVFTALRAMGFTD